MADLTSTTRSDTIATRNFTLQRPMLLGLLFLIVVIERVIPTAFTGQHNSLVLPGAALLLATLLLLKPAQRSVRLSELALWLAFSAYVLVFGFMVGEISESGRYLATVTTIALWIWLARSQSDRPKFVRALLGVFLSLVAIGGLFSIADSIGSTSRATGFFVSSPTLFAYALSLCLATFTFGPSFRGRLLVVTVTLFLIASTGSRSALLLAVLLIGWAVVIELYRRLPSSPASRGAIGTAVIMVLIVAGATVFVSITGSTNLDFGTTTETLTGRQGAAESTATRLGFYSIVTSELGLTEFVFGRGPGTTFESISQATGRRIPPHFDLLVMVSDFGLVAVVALVAVGLSLLQRHGLLGGPLVIMVAYLLSGQFHNVMFSPSMILLTLASATYLSLVQRPQATLR